MKDAKETKPDQLLGPGGRQQRSSLCKGSFKGEGLGGGCACRCSSWDRMLTTMPAKRRQRRPRWSERARAHAPRCAGGRAACGGPAARTLSGLRMGRGSNEKEREGGPGLACTEVGAKSHVRCTQRLFVHGFCPRTADGVPLDPGPLSTDERAHQGAPNTH